MSNRDITAAMQAAFDSGDMHALILVEMFFDSETLRLWTGIGDLSWNGSTWLGAGAVGSISDIEETEELQANGVNLTLSGVPSEYIGLAYDEPYQRRLVKVYFGLLDDTFAVIADPKAVFVGRMDIMNIDVGPETSAITVSVESRLIDLLKSRTWRYTHEDQQIEYPGDMGLEFVADLQNKEIRWVSS